MVLNYIRQKVGDVLGSAEPVSQNQLQSERYTRYLNRNPSQDPSTNSLSLNSTIKHADQCTSCDTGCQYCQ